MYSDIQRKLLDKNGDGRHPDEITKEEYIAAGHPLDTVMKAARRNCLACVGEIPSEVRKCTALACPMWPYRMCKEFIMDR